MMLTSMLCISAFADDSYIGENSNSDDVEVIITVIPEEEIPRTGIKGQSNESCCVMHFLLCTAALAVAASCSVESRKCRKNIARLKEILDNCGED